MLRMGLVLMEWMQWAVAMLALQTSILKKISIFIKKTTPMSIKAWGHFYLTANVPSGLIKPTI